MIVLADNDILLKLAQCDMYTEFLGAYGLTVAEVFIANRLRFSATTKKQQLKLGPEGFAKLTSFLAKVADITTPPDPTIAAALADQIDKNIDAGEAALFAVCPLIPGSFIMTGDKKCLTGLTEAAKVDATCQTLSTSLTRRIICFEQVLLSILDHVGFDAIRDRLIHGRECDKCLKLCIGSGLNATEEILREGLNSYLVDARRTSGSLLV